MANEHSLIRSVHRHLKPVEDLDIWKIKADFANGVPDCWYCGPENDLWVEYKWIHKFPKRDSTVIDLTNTKQHLSALQQQWLIRKCLLGISTAVIVGSAHGTVWFDGDAWQRPITAQDFRRQAKNNKVIAETVHSFCATKVGW